MVRSSGFLHGYHQTFAESGQRFLQPADFRRVGGVQELVYFVLRDTHGHGESADGQPFLPQSLVKGNLGGQSRAGNGRRAPLGRTGRRNGVTPHDSTGESLFQTIGGFRDGFGEAVTVRERLVEVRKGKDSRQNNLFIDDWNSPFLPMRRGEK